MQVQNLTLPRQQVVTNPQPGHGSQMGPHDRIGNHLPDFGLLAAPLLNRFQCRAAQLRSALLVFLEKLSRPRIQIPAQIIEARLQGHHLHTDRGALFHV
jgi:hypothetical protein